MRPAALPLVPRPLLQPLAHTVKTDSSLIDKLDKFRKKRNVGGYERAGTVSETEAGEMAALARQLRETVEKWIRKTNPALC